MTPQNTSLNGWVDYGSILSRVADAVSNVLGCGRVPDQVPALAGGDPRTFGLALATVAGELHGLHAPSRQPMFPSPLATLSRVAASHEVLLDPPAKRAPRAWAVSRAVRWRRHAWR
jgi:hypothetical protein